MVFGNQRPSVSESNLYCLKHHENWCDKNTVGNNFWGVDGILTSNLFLRSFDFDRRFRTRTTCFVNFRNFGHFGFSERWTITVTLWRIISEFQLFFKGNVSCPEEEVFQNLCPEQKILDNLWPGKNMNQDLF